MIFASRNTGKLLDVIRDPGPGGHFLDKSHTFQHCCNEFHFPGLSDRRSYVRWENAEDQSIPQTANQKWKKIMEYFQAPDMPESLEKDLKKYMAKILS